MKTRETGADIWLRGSMKRRGEDVFAIIGWFSSLGYDMIKTKIQCTANGA